MSKAKLRQASNRCKRAPKAVTFACAKKKYPIIFQKHGSREFWRIFNSDYSKGESTVPPVFNGPVLSCAFDTGVICWNLF